MNQGRGVCEIMFDMDDNKTLVAPSMPIITAAAVRRS